MSKETFILTDKTCRRLAKEISEQFSHYPKDRQTKETVYSIVYHFLKRDKHNRTTD